MRGSYAEDGATRVAKNGYHYTKVDGKWRLTHHVIAERDILHRPLKPGERVVFGAKGKGQLSVDNIEVVPAGRGSTRRKVAELEARIEELTAQRDLLVKELQRS
jgi:hypothetical protein